MQLAEAWSFLRQLSLRWVEGGPMTEAISRGGDPSDPQDGPLVLSLAFHRDRCDEPPGRYETPPMRSRDSELCW